MYASQSDARTPQLTQQVHGGVFWSLSSQIAQNVLRFGFSVLLARLLSPREFGLIGMVGVFTGFASIFVSLGFGQAIVQRKDLTSRHLNTAFSLSLISASAISLLFLTSSSFIAGIYHEPSLKLLMQILSCQFIIHSMGLVPLSLLERQMRFKEIALIELLAFVLGNSATIVVALVGGGVWSLVVNSFVYAIVSTVLLWRYSGWYPHLEVDVSALRHLWRYGGHLVLFNIMNYWARNADNYLIGKYCGAADLGAYNRAYQIMLLPVTQISGVVGRVLFPTLCNVREEPSRIRSVILKAHRVIALFTFPLMVMVSLLSRPLVAVLFGPKWEQVAPLLSLLSLAGMGQSLMSPGLVWNTIGRTDLNWKIGGLNSMMYILAFIVGLQWGVVGVAASYVIVWWFVIFPLSWGLAARLTDLRLWDIMSNVREVILCTGVMGVVAGYVYLLLEQFSSIIQLSVTGITGALVYWVMLRLLKVGAYREALRLLKGES